MNIIFETECDNEISSLTENIFKKAEQKFKLPKKTEITISFLTEEEIREVNLKSRNINQITDVLSFPYLNGIFGKKILLKDHKEDINPFTKCLMLGEINICLERAKEQAKNFGHCYQRECGYLALHGFLHIIGYDHLTEEDKTIMREAEEEILNSLNILR